jgi:molybdenum cofactor guanylyltransferase
MNNSRSSMRGVVLAGGRSSRMGEPKHLLTLPDGRTMLQTVVDTMRTVVDRISIVGGQPHGMGPGIDWVAESDGEGPLWAVHQLLRAGVADVLIVAASDMPLLSDSTLGRLVDARGAACFRIEGEAALQPLPLRVEIGSRSAVEDLVCIQGKRALHHFLSEADPTVLTIPSERRHEFTNINTPEEYLSMCRRLERR